VDDMAENVFLLSRILTDQGYMVKTADNGVQVINRAQEFPPDLILLDTTMPEMDGFET
jgi:CheY-like chemotaxis protein